MEYVHCGCRRSGGSSSWGQLDPYLCVDAGSCTGVRQRELLVGQLGVLARIILLLCQGAPSCASDIQTVRCIKHCRHEGHHYEHPVDAVQTHTVTQRVEEKQRVEGTAEGQKHEHSGYKHSGRAHSRALLVYQLQELELVLVESCGQESPHLQSGLHCGADHSASQSHRQRGEHCAEGQQDAQEGQHVEEHKVCREVGRVEVPLQHCPTHRTLRSCNSIVQSSASAHSSGRFQQLGQGGVKQAESPASFKLSCTASLLYNHTSTVCSAGDANVDMMHMITKAGA